MLLHNKVDVRPQSFVFSYYEGGNNFYVFSPLLFPEVGGVTVGRIVFGKPNWVYLPNPNIRSISLSGADRRNNSFGDIYTLYLRLAFTENQQGLLNSDAIIPCPSLSPLSGPLMEMTFNIQQPVYALTIYSHVNANPTLFDELMCVMIS